MAEGSRPAGIGLLERAGELARIEQAIDALQQGRGGVLVIEGAAGIGKSALLRALREAAAEPGLQTFTARGSELERDLGFGAVRQLLETRVIRAGKSEQAELLAGAARLAGPVLGLGDDGLSEPFAALHGLYWLVANVAAVTPVVLAVDDLQWVDEPSLRWLVYLCHRLEGLPVLLAATTRPPRPGHSALLAELLADSEVQILCPGPLSEPAVARLLREGLGSQPEPSFVSSCVGVSRGNPFALRELIFDLAADGVAPVAAHAASVLQRVPDQVGRAVLARLGRLDEPAVRLARATAVLGEGTELRLAAAMADLDVDAAGAAADALLAADLLAEGRPLQFVHPLVRTAVYEQLAPGARSQAHARAARLLTRGGAGYERVAAQLLLCEPSGDADAVGLLRGAAEAAVARGAPDTAGGYLRRALAEPPAGPAWAAVLSELGCAERIARNPAAAEHLEQAWQAAIEPVARARLAGQLAEALLFTADLARCSAVLQAGLSDLGDRDPDLAARLYIRKAVADFGSFHPHETREVTLERLRVVAAQSTRAGRCAQLALAGLLAVRGECCHEVPELVQRGLADGRLLAEETSEALPAILAAWALIFTDDLARAHALADAMLADARARGSIVGLEAASGRRGLVELRRGMLAEAEADTRAAFELSSEYQVMLSVPLQAAYLSLTLLERGNLDEATTVVEGIPLDPSQMRSVTIEALVLEMRARVRLARGQRADAIADLRRCGQLGAHARMDNPNLLAWRSTLALALTPEHPHEARELAQEELALARRVGSSRAIGIALRVCGLLSDVPDRIELLEQSVAVLEPSPTRLELAYSLTELGASLRRSGARLAAREPLRRALDLAHRCGATPLAERAREEALAAGARPRRPWTSGVQALTPSEFRVARLAAQAMGNRDIAQALFITTKTVSDHLSSAYRKLNVQSRDQLATAMSAEQIAP